MIWTIPFGTRTIIIRNASKKYIPLTTLTGIMPPSRLFFEIYWPHNNLLWEQYRNNEIDRQTLIIERFRYMLRPLGIEDTKSVLAINNDFLQRTTRKTRLVPGAIELLEYLRPSYRMYILSNGFREVQFKKLCNSGLDPLFPKG